MEDMLWGERREEMGRGKREGERVIDGERGREVERMGERGEMRREGERLEGGEMRRGWRDEERRREL